MTKILLVEDIPDYVELVQRMLSATDYEIIHAADAETGLQRALAECPDLILLDLGLPDYDGQTLAGWLREEETLNATPIVALTAWPEKAARLMAESYGFDGYICKVITRVEFVSQVKSFLKTS